MKLKNKTEYIDIDDVVHVKLVNESLDYEDYINVYVIKITTRHSGLIEITYYDNESLAKSDFNLILKCQG